MHGIGLEEYADLELSVAFTDDIDDELADHFTKDTVQEDLTFAYWRPSRGAGRFTAVLHLINKPVGDERILQGNVAFTSDYLTRVLAERPADSGVALLHSHLGPGWQAMSDDDVVAERDRLGGLVSSATGLPLVGLTWGTDRSWSGRLWVRAGRHRYERLWAATVRVVGGALRITRHPTLSPPPPEVEAQRATVSVWGRNAQADLARLRVGIVGLGSVGSIVAEGLSRTGIQHLTFIDHDVIEERNLDRTLGAYPGDVDAGLSKVDIARRLVAGSHTGTEMNVVAVDASLMSPKGIAAALDCDLLISCVDRPWPRHVLNLIAYAHLIPIIDGGILARMSETGTLLHVDWRVQSAGPRRACLYCQDALRRSDVALDRDGKLDDPDYLRGLTHAEREQYQRRNVFAFSLNVASLQILHLEGMVSGNARIGDNGPQTYHAYPGSIDPPKGWGACGAECDIAALVATCADIPGQW